MPKPVGALPAYPPVVCVTPEWKTESCTDRNQVQPVLAEEPASDGLEKLRQTRYVASGMSTMLGSFHMVDRECASRGDVIIRIVTEPKNGNVEIVSGTGFSTFSKESALYKCNEVKAKQQHVKYKSTAKYVGDDTVVVLALYPDGIAYEIHYNIKVR
jgi:hypothetical protein